MGNLSLGHPLASWPLSDWTPVWGTYLLFLWWQLWDSLSHPPPSVCWLHLKTSCHPLHHGHLHLDVQGPLVCLVCHHPPVMSLQGSCFWLVLTSFLLPAMQKGRMRQYPGNDVTADGLCFVISNDWAMLHHQHGLPCFLLLTRRHSLAKLPPSSLHSMARVSGSDKLESSNLNCRIKVDNGHGPVAHSAQVPPYSTQLLISKLGIMIVSSLINLSTSHWIFSHHNQSERLGIGHVLSPPCYHDAFYYCM